MISLYRIFIRSRKWTLRMIFHAMDLAVVNGWFEYRRGKEKNEVLDLLHFKMRGAEGLLCTGKTAEEGSGRKRGRPAVSLSPAEIRSKVKRERGEKKPYRELEFDAVDHLPVFDDQPNNTWCKMPNCKHKTFAFCKNCKVHLCLKKGQNCLDEFHNKNRE